MTIEIGEKCESGVRKVVDTSATQQRHRGDIVKTDTGMWLAIPMHYRNLRNTAHKLRRDAISALTE